MVKMKCLVCGVLHSHQGNWRGWWGPNQIIKKPDGTFTERGVYCVGCEPDWVLQLDKEYDELMKRAGL